MRLAGSLILMLLLLGGCGELPRPFSQAENQAFDLRLAQERNTIHVRGPQSLPDQRKADFEKMIVEGLREKGLSARRAATPRPGFARLLADSVIQPSDGSQSKLLLSWRLFSMDDELMLEPTQERQITPDAWTNGDGDLLASLSDELVSEISESFGYNYRPPALTPEDLAVSSSPGTPAEDRQDMPEAPSISSDPVEESADPKSESDEVRSGEVVVLPIEKAPGDGRESLEQAMRQVLRDSGVPVRRVPDIQDFLLEVDIELEDSRNDSQRIQIVWTLLSARDFSEIGTLTQNNRIPAGSLDGEWGDTAYAISQAAADGLIELLREAGLAQPSGQ